jgi:hypothetical protein
LRRLLERFIAWLAPETEYREGDQSCNYNEDHGGNRQREHCYVVFRLGGSGKRLENICDTVIGKPCPLCLQ